MAFVLTACAPVQQGATSALAGDTPVSRGEAFAKAHCARCHAIGSDDTSPYRSAAPLHRIAARYDLAALGHAFGEGIKVAHRGRRKMPPFQLTAHQVDDLIAYLKAIAS